MPEKLENEIMKCCQEINEKCEIQFEDFCFDHLKSRDWYLSILEILFPHLEEKIQTISNMSDETGAINAIIKEINDLDQFETLEIEGQKIENGDVNEIAKLVEVILTLLEIVMQQYEEGQNNQQSHMDLMKNKEIEEMSKNLKQKKSLSDYNKPKSVQAIGNQFEKSEEEDDEDSHFKDMELKETENPVQKNKVQSNSRKDDLNQPYKKLPDYNNEEDMESQEKMSETKKVVKSKKMKNSAGVNILNVKKNKKQLVTHPKSPDTLKKAKSSDAIALTKKAQQDIKKTKKKTKKFVSPDRVHSPMKEEMGRKNKEHHLYVKQYEHEKKQQQILRTKKKDHSEKNMKNLSKILNWREQRIKKQRKQYEQSMKMKLQDQKQRYIKQINKLILQLEREKQIQEKKDFKQSLIKDNEEAVKRLTALQHWYKNKLSMMKQNKKAKAQQRVLIKIGHKQIIGQIQKYLKKENEQKLIRLTDKYRAQHNNIETDFEELKEKIIKVYKKN